jgi:hypothetical protein
VTVPISCADERTAKYCGVSVRTVRNITSEHQEGKEGSPPQTPPKKMPQKPERNVIIHNSDSCVIKRIVTDFHTDKKLFQLAKNPSTKETENTFSLRGAVFKNTAQNWI